MTEYSAISHEMDEPLKANIQAALALLLPMDATTMMIQTLITDPEPMELSTLKGKHPKLAAALMMFDFARKSYANGPDANAKKAMLEGWKKSDGQPSFFNSSLRKLIFALAQEKVDPLPACLLPIEAEVLVPIRVEWERASSQQKVDQEAKEMKASQEKSGDPLAAAQDRLKQVDADFAAEKCQREALLECRNFTSDATTAKTQFLASNVILLDFAVQLYDLLHPTTGVPDLNAVTGAVHALCADVVAATDPNANILAGCVKSHSCAKKFNSLRAVRMRMGGLPVHNARQSLSVSIKDGLQMQDALMTISPVSFRLPVSIRSHQSPDTPKKERDEHPKRSPSQDMKAPKEKK
jgi:hypothetical protein